MVVCGESNVLLRHAPKMSLPPDISVVMSVFNGAEYLGESIESILTQEEVALELIVVNDGSTDLSGEILDKYADYDPRIRVIHQEKQGLTRSLIRGCREARGKYIARSDVADVSDSKRLLLQKAALDRAKDVAFVSCWTEFCGPQWEFLYVVEGTGNSGSPTYVISEKEKHGVIDGPTHHGSVMFRKSDYVKTGGYRAEFYYGQDWDLWYRLAEIGKFQTINRRLYRARVLPQGISATATELQTAISALSRSALGQRQSGLSEESLLTKASSIRPGVLRASSQSASLYFIAECLRRNGDERAQEYFKRSICESPFLVKAWIRMLQHLVSRSVARGHRLFRHNEVW